MKLSMDRRFLLFTFVVSLFFLSDSSAAEKSKQIVLVAGTIQEIDKPGHHDYIGGCKLLEKVLKQTEGVETVLVLNGWPKEESVLENANAIVFYTDGGGKQAFLKTPERVALIDKLAKAGVGFALFHQAVDYPKEFTEQATSWIGGTYVGGKSGRGHWDSFHKDFPKHEITSGVNPWKVADGWLNKIQFTEGLKGVTPLLWSGKVHRGSQEGGNDDIVAWAYERPAGGRTFCFSGLDMHQFWQNEGMCQFVVNGVLWSAGVKIPDSGASSNITDEEIEGFMSPRKQKKPTKKKPSNTKVEAKKS